MKITILGSNGWYSTESGYTLCILIETKDYYLVLDAGEGIFKLDKYITSEKPIFLFLSHFHLDHIFGLHILAKFRFSQPIQILGQPGTKKILEKIIADPFTAPTKILKIKIIIKDLAEGLNAAPLLPFPIKCKYLLHSVPCFGYRFELEGKVITFCTDTGICENLLDLGKDADILITECAFLTGERDEKWPHLNPEEAAMVAKRVNAKKLLLVHFDSNRYKTKEERLKAQKIARTIFADTTSGFDDLEIEI